MKNIFLPILFFFLTFTITAQNRNVKTNLQSKEINVEILAKIELNSEILQPVFSDNKIYTTEKSGLVSCYDITGKILWKHQIFSSLFSKPIIADQMLAIAVSNKEIITLRINDGEQIQSIGIDDSITTNLTLAQYMGDKELMMPKSTESKSAILFGTSTGKVMCYDLETLQEYWRNGDANGMINSQPVIIGNKILYTSQDGFLYSIDSHNGLLIWRWKEKADTDFSNSDILSDGKKIFAVDNNNFLFSIDLLLGNLTWKSLVKVFPAPGLSTDKKKLLAKGIDKRFFFISSEKGRPIKEVKLNDEFENNKISPVEYKKKMLYTNKNLIYSLNEKYKEELLVTFGDSQINAFMQIDKMIFIAANTTGTIIIFSLR